MNHASLAGGGSSGSGLCANLGRANVYETGSPQCLKSFSIQFTSLRWVCFAVRLDASLPACPLPTPGVKCFLWRGYLEYWLRVCLFLCMVVLEPTAAMQATMQQIQFLEALFA